MVTNFKMGDYFIYKSNTIDNYWIVGKLYDITTNGLTKYYKYKVVKKTNSGYNHYADTIGAKSLFMHGSIFHCNCTKITGIDDSYLLAMVI